MSQTIKINHKPKQKCHWSLQTVGTRSLRMQIFFLDILEKRDWEMPYLISHVSLTAHYFWDWSVMSYFPRMLAKNGRTAVTNNTKVHDKRSTATLYDAVCFYINRLHSCLPETESKLIFFAKNKPSCWKSFTNILITCCPNNTQYH